MCFENYATSKEDTLPSIPSKVVKEEKDKRKLPDGRVRGHEDR